jgi:tRNA 2-thiouridine synthesizing protein D
MMNMDTNTAVKLAHAALEKGYHVSIFGYGEGVTLIKEGQDPKRFQNVGQEVQDLLEKGLEVVVCETCSQARGLVRGEEIKGTHIGSLTRNLSRFVVKSDRMVTIAR